MRLTEPDRAMLAGDEGLALSIAMELVVAAGEAMGAASLLDVSRAHIDSCLYHGLAGLDFARRLVEGGGQVRIPTTLNVSSLDLLHPELYRGDPETARLAGQQMEAYRSMGCEPTWTCAPYQLVDRPVLGEQIAWGESNAIVFANSVIGARTNRYGDFLDICCALTGRAPAVGLHTDEGRVPGLGLWVDVPDSWLDEDLIYVAIGHILGKSAGTEIAMIHGLDARADEDRLKALGAAAASSGAVAMFHVDGVTPEAARMAGSHEGRVVKVGPDEVRGALGQLGPSRDELGAVSIGTPHASLAEIINLAALCEGRVASLPFYVNTSRDVLARAGGAVATIEQFGASLVTDTCTYITPIMAPVDGAVMTNSGKWAYYAPGNLGVGVVMGTMADCVESAVAGRRVNTGILA